VLHLLLILAALAGPAPNVHSVSVSSPQPNEVWDGQVRGHVAPGPAAVVVQAGKRRFAVPVAADGRFAGAVAGAPLGQRSITVAGTHVGPVWSVPAGSVAALEPDEDDPALDHELRRLARSATPYVGAYVHLPDGRAAEYNAGSQFEAASTLKLPIMLTWLSTNEQEASETPEWDMLERITGYSDNEAANQVLEAVGGSDTAGAAKMVALMTSLGLTHTYMQGGYLTGAGGGPPVITVDNPPPGAYKHTTPAEMARLAGWLVAAAAGKGPLVRHGVSPHEARELLFLMLNARDPGLVPAGAGGLPVAHKIGWLEEANNDIAIVFTHQGPVAMAVYTNGSEDGTAQTFGAAVTRAALAAARRG